MSCVVSRATSKSLITVSWIPSRFDGSASNSSAPGRTMQRYQSQYLPWYKVPLTDNLSQMKHFFYTPARSRKLDRSLLPLRVRSEVQMTFSSGNQPSVLVQLAEVLTIVSRGVVMPATFPTARLTVVAWTPTPTFHLGRFVQCSRVCRSGDGRATPELWLTLSNHHYHNACMYIRWVVNVASSLPCGRQSHRPKSNCVILVPILPLLEYVQYEESKKDYVV